MRAFDQPAYLGLDRDERWAGLITEGIREHGTHFAGSRGAAYCPPVYAQAEHRLAAWLDAPAVTLVSSGSLLAALVVDRLQAQGYTVLAGPFAHACWRRPGVKGSTDAEIWRTEALSKAAAGERIAVVSDRVCAIRCVEARLDWLSELPAHAMVVLDDSHSLGVLGPHGRASRAKFGQLGAELLVCASLGKSFSVPGAVLVSSADWAQAFRAAAAFGGASSVPPGYASALANGLDYALERRTALLANVAALENLGLVHATGHPAFLLDARQADALSEAGIAFAKTRYPTADSPEVCRVVVSSGHAAGEVARVVSVLGGLPSTTREESKR